MFNKKRKYYKKKKIYRYHSYGAPSSRRRSGFAKKIVKLFLLLIFIAAIAYGVKQGYQALKESSASKIESIEIKGNENITQNEIKGLLPFDIGESLLEINLSKAEKDIKELKPEIKKIKISRGWKKVKVKVYERTPEAFVVLENKKFGLDWDNVPFALRVVSREAQVPVIKFNDEAEIKEILTFLKSCKSSGKDFIAKMKEIETDKYKDIYFVTNDGINVYWGDSESNAVKLRISKFEKIYEDIIAKKLSVKSVDMSFYKVERAVVKLKS